MTSQNPASPNSQNPQIDRDILAKVNSHADRSIDRLFSDIDGLLDSDLSDEPSATANRTSTSTDLSQSSDSRRYPNELQQQLPPTDFNSSQSADEASKSIDSNRKKRLPWLLPILAVGATTLAVGGGLLWLVSERKIDLPKGIDTSWIPYQSQTQVAPSDVKFARYLQKSIAKIEAKTAAQAIVTTAPVAPNPTSILVAPTQPTMTIAPATITNPVAVTPAQPLVALLKTAPASQRPAAVFKIDNRDRAIAIGQKIGLSDWTLLTVKKTGITMKNPAGEIRSVNIGQKF